MTRATALLLVRHATTADTRAARFPASSGARAVEGCACLDRAGRRQAESLRGRLPAGDRVWTSMARRSRETAAVLASPGTPEEALPELAELDFGAWSGRSAAEVAAADPEGLAAWYADPASAPHGGETLADLRRRAAAVLARAVALGGTTVAVTHGGLCKAALLEALALPAQAAGALWQLDVAPASVTELHHTHERWRVVRSNWRPVPDGWPEAVAS